MEVSVLTLKTSFDSIIIFEPLIISKEDPAGIGALRSKNTSSPEDVTKNTSASALAPVLFETKILNNTNVADLCLYEHQ